MFLGKFRTIPHNRLNRFKDNQIIMQPDLMQEIIREHMFNKDTGLPRHCENCNIRHAGICAMLTPDERCSFNAVATAKHYQAGQMIRIEEEPVRFYANIISGVAKMYKSTDDGRQQIVGLLLPSDLLDRVFAHTATCSIEAITDMELCSYPKKQFEAIIRKDPDLEHRLFSITLHELDTAQEWMLLLGRKTAREKVASFLLMLSKRSPLLNCPHQEQGEKQTAVSKIIVEIPVTRSDIADYLGLTMETVCRQITHLKKDGVIDLPDNHSFCVSKPGLLAELAGQEHSFNI
jgi:CRP/FNR family transcriptional regulator